jgi:hypothetical protein
MRHAAGRSQPSGVPRKPGPKVSLSILFWSPTESL